MTNKKTPPFLGIALMLAGGIFLVFVVLQMQGLNPHERNFTRLCKRVAEVNGFNTKEQGIHCDWVAKTYVLDRAPMRAFTPRKIGARHMPHDQEGRFLMMHDPHYFAGLSYCYFSYRKWFSAERIQPEDFAMMAVGFSVLKSELKGYVDWMESKPGKECLENVHEKLSLSRKVDLLDEFKGHAALIALNPVAFAGLGRTHQEIRKAVNVSLNHERLHMLYGYCSKLQKWARSHWEKTSEMFKRSIARKHPAYNWSDPEIAAREHMAYTFESDPDLIEAQLGRCIF